ncbi:MAG: SGNH/GDSL hydrolase family protein [Candidatus Omnitrophica bacterium]|nr:SGNH/GDSL hydrolase family protein [Candidatus Omnitrophota bacterium]
MSTRFWMTVFSLAIIIAGSCPLGYSDGFLLKDGDTIVFLGDSITQLGKAPEGYVTLFKMFCDVSGYEVNVINAGISGHKSNDMLARLDKDVLSHHPDVVSISCGVNDVWHAFKKDNPSGVPLPEYKKNMTEIVDRCLQSGAKVLLLTATPIFEDLNSEENQKLAAYNEFLRQLAKEKIDAGKNIILCDLNQTFQDWYKQKMRQDNLLTTDGVHMNPRGNRLMAAHIIQSLGATNRELALVKKRWELINNM